MATLRKNRQELFRSIAEALRKEGAKKIAVFGSYARGQDTPASDIDVLVEFAEPKGLFEIVRIERQLSAEIGIKVDLLTKNALSPFIREQVMHEMKVIT